MPLHITKNYNGQLTGNTGIHSRYESTMINSYISQISYTGENISQIADVPQYIFDYIYSNYQYVDDVLDADDYAKSVSTNTYSDEYNTALWIYSKNFTIELFKDASHALTELIYTAWKEAGSPSMAATGIQKQVNELNFVLKQNFPNPFSNSTTIQFRLKENSKVLLQIKNASGVTISTLINDNKTVGDYSIVFNSENLSIGTYYLILDTEKDHLVKKMILVR